MKEIMITECSICYVNNVEVSFLCKHSLCKSCYLKVEICPFCRKKIKDTVTEPITDSSLESIRIESEETGDLSFYCAIGVCIIGPLTWIISLFVLGIISYIKN